MNGILSQILSLISYGNHHLKFADVDAQYFPHNVAFKFCNQVSFLHLGAEPNGADGEKVVAADPLSWFNLLKQENCKELKAYYHPSEENEQGTPDYKLAGFVGGGGIWLIEAIYPTHSDFWASRWEVNQPDAPDQNIWSVSYGRTVSAAETINFCPDVEKMTLAMEAILTDIHEFASEKQLDNWADVFQRALDLLKGNQPSADWYKDLIYESDYSENAMRLVRSAMAAHVFGGMGSWNDLGFDNQADNETYEELSYYLYDNINRALLSGINSNHPATL